MAILGIDEVGRGPLAGPLVVGAVILPKDEKEWFFELKDSKKISAKKRDKLNEIILNEAAATGLGWVSSLELDKLGVSESLKLATRRAVKQVQRCRIAFSEILIDGKVNFLRGTSLERFVSTMPKADDLIREVSAASIIAKVARDKYMIRLAKKYPVYGFESHVGYGTARHLAAIREYGICDEHRRSFEPIKSMVGFKRIESNIVVKNTTEIGRRGESTVVDYLEKLGHMVVERNYKTKSYEIDIISVFDDKIYFTEVKTRKDDVRGGGLYAVDRKKLQKMRFAAESYLNSHKQYSGSNPQLAVADVNGDYEVVKWMPVA